VVAGTVAISQIAEDGRELLLELVRPYEAVRRVGLSSILLAIPKWPRLWKGPN